MTYRVAMFPRIQVDTAIAYFLLRQYGEEKFPGIKSAPLEFWSELPEGASTEELEDAGYILIDLGGSKFDHHNLGPDNKTISASHLVAQFLGVEDKAEIHKLLEFARRDDLEGKGTLSADGIDRAFGFPGLLMSLNKSLSENPKRILEIVLPLLQSHFLEEYRRHEQLPAEYNELVKAGKVKEFRATHFDKQIKVIYIESDNTSLAGFLRSRAMGANLVIQRASTGHTNFITQQSMKLQLKKLARLIKLTEASKAGITLPIDSVADLELPGRTDKLPHWYYDTRANTLQNGGTNPQGIPATTLIYAEIESLVKQGLNIERSERTPRFNNPTNNERRGRGFVSYE